MKSANSALPRYPASARIQRMFIRLRAWWYERFVRSEAWPPDVREYVARSGLQMLTNVNLSAEAQTELAKRLLSLALCDEYQNLSPEFRADMLAESFCRFGKIPTERCVSCKSPVLTHEAIMIEGTPYCKTCGSKE